MDDSDDDDHLPPELIVNEETRSLLGIEQPIPRYMTASPCKLLLIYLHLFFFIILPVVFDVLTRQK